MRGFWNKDDEDDQTAHYVIKGLDAMSNRRTLVRFLYLFVTINIVIWGLVLIFPVMAYTFFDSVMNLSNKLGMLTLGVVFGLGLWITYSILRLKFPDIEDQDLKSDVLGSFAYQSHSTKRWFVWLFSVIGGVINLLGIIFVDLLLSGN